MKEILKKSWWQILVYSLIAGRISLYVKTDLAVRLSLVKIQPDGSVLDQPGWLIMSACVFAAVILIGGLVFFRRMKKKELLCSASVAAALYVVCRMIAVLTQHTYFGARLGLQLSISTEWLGFVMEVLSALSIRSWILSSALVCGALYLFVLFGRPDEDPA